MSGTSRIPATVRTSRFRRSRVEWMPVWMLAPAGAITSILLLYPIIRGILLSFFNTRLLTFSKGRYIGLLNYQNLFSDPYFWNSIRVTVLYGVGSMVCTYLVALGVALLMNRPLPGRGVLRMMFIMPWAIPEVVAVLIFVWMLDAQYGVINYGLVQAHIISQPLAWLSNANLTMPALILVTSWQQFPLAMLILLAGLQTIPEEQYEAAKVDGAGPLMRFVHVTLPGLRSVNIILILILILNSFRRVTMIYAMTGGGPARATETLSILTYNTAFQYQQIGYAAAVGVALLLILLCFSLVYFYVLGRDGAEA